jgi:hypothetical protein
VKRNSTNPPEGVCHGHLPTPRRDLGNTPVPKSRRGFSSSDMDLAACFFVGGFLGLVAFSFCTIYLLLASQL